MSELVGRVMGSELQLIAVGGPQDVVRRIAGFLDQLEQHWSRFLPDSDITHINLADGAWVTVAPETLTLLATMQAGVELTAGRYDPTMLPRLVELGYDASRHDPTKRTLLPAPAPRRGDLWDIEFDTEHSAVRVPSGLVLDAGGIGKGLAGDLAVRRALELGADGFLCSIGGDLSMGGTPPDPEGWTVEIEQPDRIGSICRFAVPSGGVATSSTVSRRWFMDRTARHHVLDPLTGEPSPTDLLTATVVATTGWQAEVQATAALLAGSDDALDLLTGRGLSGLVITDLGEILATEDLAVLPLEPVGGHR
ncbi:MAG: FAD:protein FMN transferase [Ilumatobacteraceae bacterium]